MKAIPGIRFHTAARELSVSAWGMNVIEVEAGCTAYPEHDHTKDGAHVIAVAGPVLSLESVHPLHHCRGVLASLAGHRPDFSELPERILRHAAELFALKPAKGLTVFAGPVLAHASHRAPSIPPWRQEEDP